MEMKIQHIGAQLYTVREFMKTPAEIFETFKKVKSIGYEAVQFSGAPIGDAKELRAMADEAGISIVCTHVPYDCFTENIKKTIQDHKTLGATHAGVGSMPRDFCTPEGVKAFAKSFDKIAKEFAKEGLGVTYHNHRFEFERVGGQTLMDALIENSETFSLMLDTYWVVAGGADVVDFIRKHKNRLELVHLKDMTIIENEQSMSEILEGNLNWQGIFEALAETEVAYAFVEQDTCRDNPFTCLQRSYDNIKTFLEG